MYCFGIANHSPDTVLSALVKRKLIKSESDVAILTPGATLDKDKKPKRKVLLALNLADFNRNLSILNGPKYSQVQVFLFSSPLRLAELDNCEGLDFEQSPEDSVIKFNLRSIDWSKHKKYLARLESKAKLGSTATDSAAAGKKSFPKVVRRDNQYLFHLTDMVRRGSLLNPIMTLIYTIPSTTQSQVKEAVMAYLFGKHSLDKLKQVLNTISGSTGLTSTMKNSLLDVLASDVGKEYLKAFKAYKEAKKNNKPLAPKDLVKRFKVTEYEIKYILSVVDELSTAIKNTPLSTL
jgi:hypothetical protein